jgi:hypothetical protein
MPGRKARKQAEYDGFRREPCLRGHGDRRGRDTSGGRGIARPQSDVATRFVEPRQT